MKNQTNKTIAFLLMLCMLALLAICAGAETEAKSRTSARSAALYEPYSGRFIYESNINERLPMASTTKIMTALIALEECDLNEDITVPEEATGIEGSSIYLKKGDRINILDLIYSLLLQSANDAATLLALKISGEIPAFATLMNQKAKALGLTDTNFENPHGLDAKEHYTTAHDLALLSAYALKNPEFRKICSTYKHSFCIGEQVRTVVNHNKLLKSYEGCIGVKTGYTKKSGRCLVSAANKDGVELIAVTLNAPDDWRDHTRLLDFGFNMLEGYSLSDIAKTDFTLPLIGGKEENIRVCAEKSDTRFVCLKDSEQLSTRLYLPKYISAPKKKGDTVGYIEVYLNEKLLEKIDIKIVEDIEEIKPKNPFFTLFS